MDKHPYTKLKADYDHLLGRTWDLFKLGREKEYKLETAVANAWKQFGVIAELDDIEQIKLRATQMRDFMDKTLKEHSDSKSA